MRNFVQFIAMAVLYFLILAILPACSTIGLKTPDGYEAHYSRLGNQDLSGLQFEKDKDGLYRFVLDKQSADDSGFLAFIKEWASR